MTTTKIEKPTTPGPHWKSGETPVQMGSFTNIKPVFDKSRCFSPCRQGCPATTDIQGFISLINQGKYQEAIKLIKQTNPLPLSCSRVCPAFCEVRCIRGAADESVAVNALERFISNYEYSLETPYVPEVKPATGHKVAIIGGGPAGLSAAYYLALEGHAVSIFDANSQLGGQLRYGLPEDRLPKAIVDKEVATIAKLCQEVNYNVRLNRDFTLKDLKDRGYEAIFVALGTWQDEKLGIDGEYSSGVISGTKFLLDVASGKKIDLGKTVILLPAAERRKNFKIAIDAARAALGLSAREVTILSQRPQAEIPVTAEEVAEAERAGVKVQFLTAPTAIKAKNGKVSSVTCVKMKSTEQSESGRQALQPVAGSEFELKVDTVIAAIGQIVDTSNFPTELTDSGKYIKVNTETMETAIPGVFSGGDCVRGPGTVIEAIAAGRRAAHSINQYLSGKPIEPLKTPRRLDRGQIVKVLIEGIDNVKHAPKVIIPAAGDEAASSLTRDEAKAEAERCLQCSSCRICWLYCPEGAISISGGDKKPAVNRDLCKACGVCVNECPGGAIALKTMSSAKNK